MKGIDRTECNLLKILFESNRSLEAYTLWKRSRLPHPVFMKFLKNLAEQNFLVVLEQRVKLTEEGVAYNAFNAIKDKEQLWKKIPKTLLREKLDEDDFYIPSIKKLDKATFNCIATKLT